MNATGSTIVIMASLLRTCFQNEDPYTLAGCGRDRFLVAAIANYTNTVTVLRKEKRRTMRTRVFVVPLFAANLRRVLWPAATPLLFPSSLFSSFFLSLSFHCRYNLFFPENVLPTVISVINDRPLTTRFILDHRFVSKGKDRLPRQMWDLVPGQRISSARFCTVTRLAFTYMATFSRH